MADEFGFDDDAPTPSAVFFSFGAAGFADARPFIFALFVTCRTILKGAKVKNRRRSSGGGVVLVLLRPSDQRRNGSSEDDRLCDRGGFVASR